MTFLQVIFRYLNSTILQREASGRTASLVAPPWHTCVLLGFVFLASTSGAYLHWGRYLAAHLKAFRYLVLLLWQWAMLAFVLWGVRKRGIGLAQLTGGSWTALHFLRDISLAIGFLFVSYIVLVPLALALKPGYSEGITRLVPHGRLELLLYLLVAASAGFIEEIIFRGYLQRQLSAIFDSTFLGLVFQSVIFGVGHGYQGAKRMLILGVFGFLLGALAIWRRSLRPGMIAHGLQDSLFGILGGVLRR